MVTPVNLLNRAQELRDDYVLPWVGAYIVTGKPPSREDDARAFFAFKFLRTYDDAACDDKVLDHLTNAIIWSGGFHQFERQGARRRRARHFRQLRREVAEAHEESMAALEALVPMIEQIFVQNIDPVIVKLSA
jgi:hypothetical protein